MAAPTVRAGVKTTTSFSASVVVTTVATYLPGDVLLVGLASDVTVTTTPPAGFTLIKRVADSAFGNDQILESYAKIAVTNEPATFTFTLSTAEVFAAFMVAIQGAQTSTTPHKSAVSTAVGGVALINAPSVTTTVSDCLILTLYGVDNSPAASVTYASLSMTEVVDITISSWASISMYSTTKAVAGGVSTYAVTSSPTGLNGRLMQTIAFAPSDQPYQPWMLWGPVMAQ